MTCYISKLSAVYTWLIWKIATYLMEWHLIGCLHPRLRYYRTVMLKIESVVPYKLHQGALCYMTDVNLKVTQTLKI